MGTEPRLLSGRVADRVAAGARGVPVSWRRGDVLAVVLLVAAPAVGIHALKPYQSERLTAFLHPSSNFQQIKEKEAKTGEPDPAYQLAESKIAIGSGQKTGRGINATQTRLNYVPEDHTDFVFAAVGEQYGFVGAAFVLLMFTRVPVLYQWFNVESAGTSPLWTVGK